MASNTVQKDPKPREAVPEVGSKLSIRLPLETTRATVLEALDSGDLIVKLDVMEPMAKTHGYFFNDKVVVTRKRGFGGLPLWDAMEKVA